MNVSPFREFRAKLLGARVMRLVNLFQSLFHHVRVNLSSGNIRMPKHHLHGAKIGPAIEQMRGKTVPQRVWLQGLPQLSLSSVLAHDFPDGDAIHRPSSLI
jgi:hypothetical protein